MRFLALSGMGNIRLALAVLLPARIELVRESIPRAKVFSAVEATVSSIGHIALARLDTCDGTPRISVAENGVVRQNNDLNRLTLSSPSGTTNLSSLRSLPLRKPALPA